MKDITLSLPADRKEGVSTTQQNSTTPQQIGCTLAQYAAAKRLPVDFLKELGLSDITYQSAAVVRIPYLNAEGTDAAVRFRTALTGRDKFRWRSGNKPTLYINAGLIIPGAAAVLVEGESDCHTLWYHGICAYGLPGANNWKQEYAELFAAHEIVYIVIEPDTGGEAILKWLARSTIRHKVRLVRLEGFKDPSEMYCNAPELFVKRWQQAVASAMPYSEHERKISETKRGEAWEACSVLAESSDILTQLVAALKQQGFVGQEREAKLLFLIMVSRLLDRPVSCKISGPSSGGKSFLLNSILKFFPEYAFYLLTL